MNRSILIGTVLILLGFFLNITAKASSLSINPKRIIVKLKNGKEIPSINGIKKSVHFFETTYVLYTNGDESLLNKLRSHQDIQDAQFDTFSKRGPLPTPIEAIESETTEEGDEVIGSVLNDPKLAKLWAFKDASKHGMSVSRVYEEMGGAQSSEPIIVAVVDTGVDYNHEDLKDVMWTNVNEIPGNGIDDDGNGYIDDIHGINTLERDSDGNATGDMMDGHSHGTHVSGTIAATQNNGVGIAGVASNVRIMGLRSVPSYGDETDVDIAESFLYAARNGAKVINCSFGKSHNEGGMLVKETIDYIAKTYNTLVVVSAGNSSQNIDTKLTYPASYDSEGMLVVASSTRYGRFSYFSNYGFVNVDVAAPGSSIYSTTPGNRYGNMSGTSMASPNVTGVAAEVLSRHSYLTAIELKNVLMNSVTTKSSMDGDILTGGVVDLYSALESL
ncbi:peptidase, S8/S53 family [Bacteriovorax sp. BAL6_X]|uniref:S8 family peptidase n=1 Tax=Bacteriovorax sp. BAL6_X TaxID=1201290 RepID=UPI00038674D2|nr:S8 family peptidase [Bacteriovorax sp. BAL6_X]EPZ50935.1 peptidase, S8/S53 family [Bacteriovorax sp. BAL6_X]